MSGPARSGMAAALLLALFAATVPAAAQTDGFALDPAFLEQAIFSCGELSISGNSVVISEGLATVSALAGRGHIRSNADVRLDGSVEIDGDATAGPGRQVVLNGSAGQVTGTIGTAEVPLGCRPIDLAALAAALEGSNDNAAVPLSAKGNHPLSGADGRAFELKGRDSVVLPAGTYLFSSLRLSGNSAVTLEGPVRILVTGEVDVTGSSHIHLNGDPYRLRLWSSGQQVRITSRAIVHGFVYAPDGAVDLGGQGRVAGGVFAGAVSLAGGSRVRRMIDDVPPQLIVTTPVDGEVVEVCTIPVAGSVTDAQTALTLTVDGAPAEVGTDGAFATTTSLFTADPGLVAVEAADLSGNTVRAEVRVSIVPPSVALTSPPPGSLVGERVVTLSGEAGTATAVTVDGVAATVAGGTFTVAGFDLGADGLKTLSLIASNCGGEVTATAVLDLDTLPPEVAIDSPEPGQLFGSTPITVSGTVADAHLASVTVGGVTATVSGGRFTAEGVALAEGDNSLTAVATDALGRSTVSPPVAVELDTTAPSVDIDTPAPESVVATSLLTVEGSVSDPNLADVEVNGVPAVVAGTRFTAAGVLLAEGENRLVATATDQVGNSAVSSPVVVVLDTLPPEVTLDAAALPELTEAGEVTATGTVSDPHLAGVTVNGVAASVVAGTWVAEGVSLEEGPNSLVALATDTLGHSAESAPAIVTRDTLAPEVAITEPVAGAELASRTVTVRGTVTDPHLESVTVLGVPAAVSGGSFEAVGVELQEGESEITARAVDTLGHSAVSAPVPVVVDTLPPAVRLDSPSDPVVPTPTVTVTGTVEEPHLLDVTVSGLTAVVEGATYRVEGVPLAEGDNQLTAIARDTFGHSATSEPVPCVLDSLPPEIAIESPLDGDTLSSLAVTVEGTVSDPNLFSVTVNGVEAAVADGRFSAVVPLAKGANPLRAVAIDAVDHSAEVAVTVFLDGQPPLVSIDQPAPAEGACLAGGTLHTLGGAFSDPHPATGSGGQPPAVAVRVQPTSGPVADYTGVLSAGGRRWSLPDVDLGSTDGKASVLVTATDLLGNASQVSRTFRLDATPPVVSLLLDGLPFPGAVPEGSPPGEPVLFNRALTPAVRVEDAGTEVPPEAVLTLDGAPYSAGTPIASAGEHLLLARATDCAGRTVGVLAAFRIDLTGPALTSTTPADGAVLTAGPAAFSGASDPDLAAATVNGVAATLDGGTFIVAPFPWREGLNQVEIALTDQAGNRTVHQRRFTVRSLPLTVEIREGGLPIVPGTTFLRSVQPEIRASDPAAAVTATLNGTPFVSGGEIATSGEYTLAASADDDLGRSASASVAFRVDLSAGPEVAITSPADGATVPGPAVTVVGTIAGSGVTVTVNGVTATVTGGTWTAADVPLEVDAPNLLTALATDAAGRRSSISVTVLAVSAGARILILEPAEGALTNRAAIDVAGVVVGGRRASADGTVTVAGVGDEVEPDGSFRVRDVPLAEGANLLTARTVDPRGVSAEASVTVTSDRTPPAIELLGDGQPLAEGATFGPPLILGVRASDGGGPAVPSLIRLNGEPQTIAGALTEISIAATGGYVVAVVARDAAGNEARAERSFLVDDSPCALAGVEPPAGSALAAATVTLRGRSGGASTVTVRVPRVGGGFDDYAATLADGTFLAGDVPLPITGVNALELVCTNSSAETTTLPYPIERLPGSGPVVTIESPADGALLTAEQVSVSGRVTAGTVRVNGIAAAITPPATGTADGTFQAAGVPLVEGPNILGARAVDGAGRSGNDRVVVDRDSQAPRLTLTSPAAGSRLGRAGSGPLAVDVTGAVDLDTEPHLDRVTVSAGVPGGTVTALVDPATGSYRAAAVPLDAALPAGSEQTVTATAVDALGHSASVTVTVTVDPEGPAIVLTAPADLTAYSETSPGAIPVAGEAWAEEGAQISLNGATLDPAGLAWSAPAADGRRHVAFTATLPLPPVDGPFGLVARVSELDGDYAQERRLLSRDGVPPEVVEIHPAGGSAGVDPDSLLLVLFSEPVAHASLTAADGLTLTRLPGGETVVGRLTVAGNAVAFAPGASLAAGESYRFRAGTGVTDRVGHPLVAPAEATFTVAVSPTAAAPQLDPLPPVFCGDQLTVTGLAAAGATVKVRDGSLVFSGQADAGGAFAITVPMVSAGYHLLRVFTVDTAGTPGPEAAVAVRLDCSAPTVIEAAFDRSAARLAVTFSEPVDPASLAVGGVDDALRLSDAEDAGRSPQTGTLLFPTGQRRIEIELDPAPDAWWRERPVRLEVRPPAADLQGNVMAASFETVFFPGGGGDPAGGFLFGEAYDDASGRPLDGVEVRLYPSGAVLPGTAAGTAGDAPVAAAGTEGRGRFTLAGEVPAGRYALLLTRDGYTRVVRRLALQPAAGAVPFDSRLTPLAAAAGNLEPATGGRLEAPESLLAYEADALALPGTEPVAVTLTALSGQGLPDVLPLGWTPAAAADVRLLQAGEVLADGAAAGVAPAGTRLELPLPAWVEPGDELFAARYDLATGVWRALVPPQLVTGVEGGSLARLILAGPGTVAVLVADEDAATRPPVLPVLEGEALTGSGLPAALPALVADLELEPPVVPPTGRSRARVVARSADGVTPWPSGLAVQAFLDEKLILASGAGQLLEAPFSADLLLYHPRLDAAEQGGNASGSAGALEFVVSPSPRAAEVLLDVGYENIRLFPFPEEVERGSVIGPAGGSVESGDGVELVLPEGALTAPVAVAVELLPAAELAALAPVEGYQTLAAVRVELGGLVLARQATLRLPTPAGTPVEVAGDRRIVLAELIQEPADFGASYPRLAARTRRLPATGGRPERIEAAPGHAGALPLEGILREGLYLVLRAEGSLGFATGFVRAADGSPLAASRVVTAGLGTADVSALSGRYVLPVPAGPAGMVTARHPVRDEAGSAPLPGVAPEAVVEIHVTVLSVPPSVVSLAPSDGATGQPVGSTVSVLFSEPLDPASVGAGTLSLALADDAGAPTAARISGAVTLSADGRRVLFAPERPLPPGRRLAARFHGGVRDAGGTFYAGPVPVTWSFTTSTSVAPGGQVHPERFRIQIPVGGVAQISGEPGAVPATLAGETPWIVVPEIQGPVADPVVESIAAAPDGSFTGSVGHPPEFPVTLGSRVWVKVFDPAGNLAAHFRLGPFASADGRGFVAPAGERVIFRTAEGVVVDVPAAAFTVPTQVTVRTLPLEGVSGLLPAGMVAGAYLDVDFAGEARETLRLSVPAPAAAADDAQVFIGRPVDLRWGRRLELISVGGVLHRDGERFLSNDPSVQPPADALLGGAGGGSGLSDRSSSEGTGSPSLTERALPEDFYRDVFQEFRLRGSAVFAYETGAGFALVTGGLSLPFGSGDEAIYNALADAWVYLPSPHDWNGRFALPVPVGQPLELVRRDVSSGWIITSQAVDPIAEDTGGLIEVPFTLGEEPAPPLLLDARPFHLVRFGAPGPGQGVALRLDIQAAGDSAGRVVLFGNPAYPLPDHTGLALFDLAPALPAEPETEPEAPREGPVVQVCGNGDAWSSEPFDSSDDLLLVVSPGDLDAGRLDAFEFEFDRRLEEVSERPAAEVAVLDDLGPSGDSGQGCGASSSPGYPRRLDLEVELADTGTRLVVRPLVGLPAGHRFRLELIPTGLVGASESGTGSVYWATAPRRFEFATRRVPGETVGSLAPGEIPAEELGRVQDLLRFGNLVLTASTRGDLVALDASDPTGDGKLRLHAVKNSSHDHVRSLATDGHGRVFFAGRFASIWSIRAVRVEAARRADAACINPPSWAPAADCFDDEEGAARIAYALGSGGDLLASEWLALGGMPVGTPVDLEVLAADEVGEDLELAEFYRTYTGEEITAATPDADGFYHFHLPVSSTYVRSTAGQSEPSLSADAPAAPAFPAWRREVCTDEPQHDRYQRVTVENLTTGQSWSFDVENPWPGGGGSGTHTVTGVTARRGDRLRVRYNLSVLGYAAVMGSGITVVDLNRSYRLPLPEGPSHPDQCGRRLAKFEGQGISFPTCTPALVEGLSMTPSVAVHSQTGCDGDGVCRGAGRIDTYSPLINVGGVHAAAGGDRPGGAGSPAGETQLGAGLELAELAACITRVAEEPVWLRDVALYNEATWLDTGLRGSFVGLFAPSSSPGPEPEEKTGDLLFLSLGDPGVFVFDVSERVLDEAHLIGRLAVPGHSAERLQVDPLRGLLFAGGTDSTGSTPRPVINVWDVAAVNGAPGTAREARPLLSLHAPWRAARIALSADGTGLLYTWDDERGLVGVPFERIRFIFSGLYRPRNAPLAPDGAISPSEQQATRTFVPLGAAMAATPEVEEAEQEANEERATAAFKVRLALPGSLGEELTARVESLRMLPDERYLAHESLGPAAALPGGPGWPQTAVYVTLRRLGGGAGEAGRLSSAYNLYESVETVLLLADPRAGREYRRQDLPAGSGPGSETADEAAQCRRCDWPSYLPDPATAPPEDPELSKVRELLVGGPYLRIFLAVDPASGEGTRQRTQAALDFFAGQGPAFPPPVGFAEVAGWADAVPSPVQVSLAEPARHPALFTPGEAGVSVSLSGGELLLSAIDHRVEGRGLPFAFERSYRSGALGYGPLGSAGWSAGVFAHLRELPTTGEVEYHDGSGHVWRFLPRDRPLPSEAYERDNAGSYHAPKGLDLRLEKLRGGQGWRLIGRRHTVVHFDGRGRLVTISDRFRRGRGEHEQGNTLRFRHDVFGRLVEVVDDLGRSYRFDYFEDPRPEASGGDGARYGLLRQITDFAGRTVEYEWAEDRTLTRVRLPEVRNPTAAYAAFSHEGPQRPELEYAYGPDQGVTSDPADTRAVLHGEFARLRLASFSLPELTGGARVPRARFGYEEASGRLVRLSVPDGAGRHDPGGGISWQLAYGGGPPAAGPAGETTVTEPWGHAVAFTLEEGRIVRRAEELEVVGAGATTVETTLAYTADGRLTRVGLPDGGERVYCHADGEGGEGCTGGGGTGSTTDRLARANLVEVLAGAGLAGDTGGAPYTRVVTAAAYQEDNVPSAVVDGLGRRIELPVPETRGSSALAFTAEGVSGRFTFDRFGRPSRFTGGGEGGPQVALSYGEDARGVAGAGLLTRLERGSPGSPQLWEEIGYDRAFNPAERRTSFGETAEVVYDEWDRPVRERTGVSRGLLPPAGSEACEAGSGAQVERAFDAAGHLVAERRLQDHVGEGGVVACRWVERRFVYNAREQLVAVEESHLASATEPGTVTAGLQRTEERLYDGLGRLSEVRRLNAVDPPRVTRYRYDAAGRAAGVTVGQGGERQLGYDEKSRVVLRSDGDAGLWRGRYDVWDRLYQETLATGAVVRRRFDAAHRLTEEAVFAGDPAAGEAELLARVRVEMTSFGEPALLAEALAADGQGGIAEERVTVLEYDGSGRLLAEWSGPGDGAGQLDLDQARRERERVYEADAGRVLLESTGGAYQGPALHARRYEYSPESRAPWPDLVAELESVPGEAQLVETSHSALFRDVFGRVVREAGDSGRLLTTVYDRQGGPILMRSGAGTEQSVSLDGGGLPVRVSRADGRGATLYAYDLDGRLRRAVRQTAGGSGWTTRFTHDPTGRVVRIDHPDDSFETFTYHPDHRPATRVTREGVEVAYAYDAANRLRSATPTATGALPASLAPLDAGDVFSYDELSRLTRTERGRAGAAGLDPALAVAFPDYDLGSRPLAELVGTREPLLRRWDPWGRPVELTLPAGVGRESGGPFTGFARDYDTLDRLVDVGAAGGGLSDATPGATWVWGGLTGGGSRLFALDTKAALGTAARYGYLDGAGPQPAGASGSAPARWKLGTLTWGSAADGAGGVAGATDPPGLTWDRFAFGWRGIEADPRDGAKIGRAVGAAGSTEADSGAGPAGLFTGMGWSWSYDAGVRLARAVPGDGSRDGSAPPGATGFSFDYGEGDELERTVHEAVGAIVDFTHGPSGRIAARDGEPFAHDLAGRRTEDDRFGYRWDWRGQLAAVTVKESWPAEPGPGGGEPVLSPFAGHQVRYAYDALGRLTAREHRGRLPEGESDDATRPFIERRVYLWEGQGLLAETAYGSPDDTHLRWRKTYVLGPGGLDDAVQVAVEVVDLPGSPYPGTRLYTYLRDELGTVVALVAEDEAGAGDGGGGEAGGEGGGESGSAGPARPPVPVRYFYTPYGEAHAETGPELLEVRFDTGLTATETAAGPVTQTVADPAATAAGGVRIHLSLPVTDASLAAGLAVERLAAGSGWTALPAADVAIGRSPSRREELEVLLASGWTRGTAYRIRLTQALQDHAGRPPAEPYDLQWSVPADQAIGVIYHQRFPRRFDSSQAASATAAGRFPGGQNHLFQGLWTDPVTGLSYARARWYDARNAAWLSEDPLEDVDSPALYTAFGNNPVNFTDPLGTYIVGGLKELSIIRQALEKVGLEHLASQLRLHGVQTPAHFKKKSRSLVELETRIVFMGPEDEWLNVEPRNSAIREDEVARRLQAGLASLLYESITTPYRITFELTEEDLSKASGAMTLGQSAGLFDTIFHDRPHESLIRVKINPTQVEQARVAGDSGDIPVPLEAAVIHEFGHAYWYFHEKGTPMLQRLDPGPSNALAVVNENRYRYLRRFFGEPLPQRAAH